MERRLIRTGVYRKGLVEVVDGLDPGDFIVSKGHGSLHDGEVVRVHGDGGPAGVEVAAGQLP